MKVTEASSVPTVYQPRAITLTIESQAEEDVLKDLFGMEITVPNAVFRSDPDKRQALSVLMNQVYHVLS